MSVVENKIKLGRALDELQRSLGPAQKNSPKSSKQKLGILAKILMNVDIKHFSQLQSRTLTYQSILFSIDRYLSMTYNMRIQHQYKIQLAYSQPISQLISLILFLIEKRHLKEDFIEAMGNSGQAGQDLISQCLQSIEDKIQDLGKINKLKLHAEQLQKSNEILEKAIIQAQQSAENINTQANRLAAWQQLKINELNTLSEEKKRILDSIGNPHCNDFSNILEEAYQQHHHLIRTTQKLEQQIQNQQKERLQLQQNERATKNQIMNMQMEKQFWQLNRENLYFETTNSQNEPSNSNVRRRHVDAKICCQHQFHINKSNSHFKINYDNFHGDDNKHLLKKLQESKLRLKQLLNERDYLKQETRVMEAFKNKRQSRLNQALQQYLSLQNPHFTLGTES